MLILIVTPMVFAEDLVFKKDNTIDLKVNCFDVENDVCAGECSLSVLYPNNSLYINSVKMSKNNLFYNYTLQDSSIIGKYSAVVNCSDTSASGYTNFNFYINARGDKPDIAQSIIYFILLLLIGIFLILSVYGTFEVKNKYIGMFLFGISYILLIWLTSIIQNISIAYLEGGWMINIIDVFFRILLIGSFPLLIFILAMIIYNVITDKQIKELVRRGLR